MSKQLIDEYFQSVFGFIPGTDVDRRISYDDPRLKIVVLNMLRDSDPELEVVFKDLFARVMDRILNDAPGFADESTEMPETIAENMRAALLARKSKRKLIENAQTHVVAMLKCSVNL